MQHEYAYICTCEFMYVCHVKLHVQVVLPLVLFLKLVFTSGIFFNTPTAVLLPSHHNDPMLHSMF